MIILLNIVLVLCLSSAFVLFIYTWVVMPRRFFRQVGNSVQFRCTTCHTVCIYAKEDVLKMTWKPRNTLKITVNGVVVKKKVSFRSFCDVCNAKTMHEPVSEPYTSEQKTKLYKKIIILMGVIFCFMIVGIAAGVMLDKLK